LCFQKKVSRFIIIVIIIIMIVVITSHSLVSSFCPLHEKKK